MEKEEFRKNLYKALSDEFDTGTKESPFDANNSEFHKPRIDLYVVPKLMEDIDQLIFSAVEEELYFLYKEYAEEDDSKLHKSAKPIKKNLLKLVNSVVQEKLNDYDAGSLEYKIIKLMLEDKIE